MIHRTSRGKIACAVVQEPRRLTQHLELLYSGVLLSTPHRYPPQCFRHPAANQKEMRATREHPLDIFFVAGSIRVVKAHRAPTADRLSGHICLTHSLPCAMPAWPLPPMQVTVAQQLRCGRHSRAMLFVGPDPHRSAMTHQPSQASNARQKPINPSRPRTNSPCIYSPTAMIAGEGELAQQNDRHKRQATRGTPTDFAPRGKEAFQYSFIREKGDKYSR